jgi:surface protein
MKAMFHGGNRDAALAFNQPIGEWDTSKVTDMVAMFARTNAFNQPIGDWDTSEVVTFSHMFNVANAFNQPIGDWDTSKVTNMRAMFHETNSFNQPIGDWDTAKVTTMERMFKSTKAFDQDISGWNLSSRTRNMDTRNMFQGATAYHEAKAEAEAQAKAEAEAKAKAEAEAKAKILAETKNRLGGGWVRVRHIPSGKKWSPSRDHLAGTDIYGSSDDDNKAWSIKFGTAVPGYDQFLFASGDGKYWVAATKDAVQGEQYSDAPRDVMASSDNADAHQVKWYNRRDQP